MKYLLALIAILTGSLAFSQHCIQSSRLYVFKQGFQPRHFSERLGNHPEFPFLQTQNGVKTIDQFLEAIRDTANQSQYTREFKAFDLLLRNSGFRRGYKDLTTKNVTDGFVPAGTVGNLGFYDKQKDEINYIYVKLNPAGESASGIAAWKLTNRTGCYLYILHTCGNAFYPQAAFGSDCCKSISVQAQTDSLLFVNDSTKLPLLLTVNLYQAQIIPSTRNASGYDTIVHLLKTKDTTVFVNAGNTGSVKVFSNPVTKQLLVCNDSILSVNIPLLAEKGIHPAGGTDTHFVLSDTSYYQNEPQVLKTCNNKWEISADGGLSFNSIPRLNSATQHTQTNGSALTAELAVSRIFNHWFQAGLSVSYFVLSYQDDVLYTGTVAGTYNKVYIGKPLIPVQLFGKATIGKPIGWQSNISLSAGYALVRNSEIENSGNTLSTKPNSKSGPTAGLKLGIAYFFSCRFGIGVSFAGQYFTNKSDLMNYKMMALPVTAGLRYRF